ncbi:glycoside hydrolase [Linderina pennispora]|uniref:Glycoside hydrolase n=1 Tax=Linderina pennispora TaxID=61395 RepID=A0A1Y1WGX8_9FUNG|nr:glycoside hydrolase [Linderina pennispora]ORX72820.1 glycoside hydrolase [Linderina pennispora]
MQFATTLGLTNRLAGMRIEDVPEPVISSGILNNTVVFGYTYAQGIKVDTIPWDSLTHLVLAFFNVDAGGNVVSGAGDVKLAVGTAHQHGVRVIASIGGSGDPSAILANVLSNNKTRANLVASVTDTFPNSGQQINDLYLALRGQRQALDAKFGDRAKELTMTLYSTDGKFGPSAPKVDASMFSDIVDYGLLMAYDFFGSWADITAPNSPFYDIPGYPGLSFTSAISAWLDAGWSADRLVAGLPYYGRTAIVESSNGTQFMQNSKAAPPGGPVSKIDGAWTWLDLRDPTDGALKEPARANQGWVRTWDNTTMTPWLLHNVSRTYIGYDDADSITIKTQHMIEKGLAGAMVWMINYDYKGELGAVVDEYTAACRRLAKAAYEETASSEFGDESSSEDVGKYTSSHGSKGSPSSHNGPNTNSACRSGVSVLVPAISLLLLAALH